jgi:hypothetical protein
MMVAPFYGIRHSDQRHCQGRRFESPLTGSSPHQQLTASQSRIIHTDHTYIQDESPLRLLLMVGECDIASHEIQCIYVRFHRETNGPFYGIRQYGSTIIYFI